MENVLGFSGFPGFKTVSESAKQSKKITILTRNTQYI